MRKKPMDTWLEYHKTLSEQARDKAHFNLSNQVLSLLAKMLAIDPSERPTADAGWHELCGKHGNICTMLDDTRAARKEKKGFWKDLYWDEVEEVDLSIPQVVEPGSGTTSFNSLFDEEKDQATIQPEIAR